MSKIKIWQRDSALIIIACRIDIELHGFCGNVAVTTGSCLSCDNLFQTVKFKCNFVVYSFLLLNFWYLICYRRKPTVEVIRYSVFCIRAQSYCELKPISTSLNRSGSKRAITSRISIVWYLCPSRASHRITTSNCSVMLSYDSFFYHLPLKQRTNSNF